MPILSIFQTGPFSPTPLASEGRTGIRDGQVCDIFGEKADPVGSCATVFRLPNRQEYALATELAVFIFRSWPANTDNPYGMKP